MGIPFRVINSREWGFNLGSSEMEQLGTWNSDGWLYFSYTWGSDSGIGNYRHLTNCTVGEIVDYPGEDDPYPWPDPWTNSSTNPYAPTGTPGEVGQLIDQHKYGAFATPYKVASFSATPQYYRYTCDVCTPGEYENLLGPFSIDRSVYADGGSPSGWQYKVEKSGENTTYDLP